MKTMKKMLLLMTCTFVLLGTAACSSRDNADNGADQSTQNDDDRKDTDRNDTDNSNVNDATDGDGIIDNAVDDVTDGVDDVTDGVDKATDDLTEDNGAQKDMQENR